MLPHTVKPFLVFLCQILGRYPNYRISYMDFDEIAKRTYMALDEIDVTKIIVIFQLLAFDSDPKDEPIYYIAPWMSKQPVCLPIGPM